MCAKLHQVISKLVPEGPIKEACKAYYYSLYYNRKHRADNGFDVYYRRGHFEYKLDGGIEFSSYENMSDELKRSLRGYLAHYSPKKGDIVIDCGAYIGEFTLYAAKAVGPDGRVIAFEPDPNINKALIANIKLNALDNVTVVNKGLWSRDGVLKFVGDSARGYSFVFAEGSPGAIDVPVVTLDSELARLGVKRVDFIKADIEGAEVEFLKGAANTLRADKISLAIASYHIVDGRKSHIALEKALALLGFTTSTAHPVHLTTYASKP